VTHSAIERKRRDQMNEKINVLRKLVPTASARVYRVWSFGGFLIG
jgi:hypothetical protein